MKNLLFMKLYKVNWRKFGRIIVFIDAANVIYSCKSLGWKIKYQNMQKYFKRHCRLVDIYFYFAKHAKSKKDANFLGVLANLGFQLKVRIKKVYKNQDGSCDVKGNVDGELIVDMISLKEQFDTAILMSGDSDFKYVVDYLRRLGKKVIIISTKYHVSKQLIDAGDIYINLKHFRGYWSFDYNPRDLAK